MRLFSRRLGTSFTCLSVHPHLVRPCLIRGNRGAGGDESCTSPRWCFRVCLGRATVACKWRRGALLSGSSPPPKSETSLQKEQPRRMLQEQGSHLSHAEGWTGEKPLFSHLCDDSFQRKQGGGKELSGPCWVLQEGSVVVAPILLNEQSATRVFFSFFFFLYFHTLASL